MPNIISCAIFYTNGDEFLAVHPTNSDPDYWDLPKGINERNETHRETAVREFEEEVGISIDKNTLQYVGYFSLYGNKNIVLYVYNVDKLIPIDQLICSSYVKKLDIKEIDEFKYFKLNEYHKIRNELHKCYNKIIRIVTDISGCPGTMPIMP